MQEVWLDVWGNVCALISGEGVVHGEYGDLINANEERWHRATSCPNTGRSISMAITPRSKQRQVHYFQINQPPGNYNSMSWPGLTRPSIFRSRSRGWMDGRLGGRP